MPNEPEEKLVSSHSRVKGLLAGLGVSLSVAGFAAMIKSAIDAADQLNKLSQKIGISVEALSTLRFAAQLSDVSLETLQKGIKGLSQNIAEANTGVGDGAQVFDALGISVKNADGSMKSTEAVLLQVADVFANLEDGAVKTALAVKVFGKSGMDMIPFLNQGSSGIRALVQEAERLGATVVKPAQKVFWGGYSGYFKDLDGYVFEVAYNPFWEIDSEGSLVM